MRIILNPVNSKNFQACSKGRHRGTCPLFYGGHIIGQKEKRERKKKKKRKRKIKKIKEKREKKGKNLGLKSFPTILELKVTIRRQIKI